MFASFWREFSQRNKQKKEDGIIIDIYILENQIIVQKNPKTLFFIGFLTLTLFKAVAYEHKKVRKS